MSINKKVIRQGDVLLVKVDSIPVNSIQQENNDRVVLASGEKTGHAHAIYEPEKAKLWDHGAERYLQVVENTILKHEEHTAADIPVGNYLVVIQTEYTPQELRSVTD